MAQYRCVFCRKITIGKDERAPPCARYGRMTTRILEATKVRAIRDGRGWP